MQPAGNKDRNWATRKVVVRSLQKEVLFKIKEYLIGMLLVASNIKPN